MLGDRGLVIVVWGSLMRKTVCNKVEEPEESSQVDAAHWPILHKPNTFPDDLPLSKS